MVSDTEGSAGKTQCDILGFAQRCSSFTASITREPEEGKSAHSQPDSNVLRFTHVPVTADAEREEAGWKGVARNKRQEGEERKGTGWERKGRPKCMSVASLRQALSPNSARMFPFPSVSC